MKKIFFIHPFKVGGTSLMMFLSNNYKYDAILPQNFFPTSFEYVTKGEIKIKQPHIIEHYDLIMGHIRYECLDELQSHYDTISLIRDPIERVVSRYHHLKRTPESDFLRAPEKQKELISNVRKYSLYDLLDLEDENIKFNFHNHQYKMLSSTSKEKVEDIVKHHGVIGCLEKMECFLAFLSDSYAFYPIKKAPELNKGSYNRETYPALLKKIEVYNREDIILYEKVRSLW